MKIIAIVAMAKNRVIGKNGTLPWHIPEDLKFFKEKTSGYHVLMGRKTWDSLPEKFKPLPNRENIVASRGDFKDTKAKHFSNLEESLAEIKQLKEDKILWIIGGAGIYKETYKYWDELYVTHIDKEYDGDTYFIEFEKDFRKLEEQFLKNKEGINMSFVRYEKIN